MKKSSRALLGLITVIAVAACGGGGGMAEQDDSPEFRNYQYRQSLMRLFGAKAGPLRAMVEGEMDVNDAMFTEYANDLAALTGMLSEGFAPGSDVGDSAALPEIWTNQDDFRQKVQDLQTAAAELARQANAGGFEAGSSAMGTVGMACGGCHRTYRGE